MSSTAYKQWTAAIRTARFAEYKAARAAGRLSKPGACEICGQTKGTMHHAEDYGPTVDDYFAALHSLCGRCHAWLHMRFRYPGLWARYKQICRKQGPQPPVKHMGEVFHSTSRGKDIPVVNYPHQGRWWEVLSTERYTENGTLFSNSTEGINAETND